MVIVKDVMTMGVISIDENATVEEAMKTVVERHVSCLIVEKSSEDDIDGIVTRKDIITKVVGLDYDPKKVKVADIMTKPLMTVTPQMDMMHVARLMAKTNVRRSPVRENDNIVGIISNSDIFRAYVMDKVIKKK